MALLLPHQHRPQDRAPLGPPGTVVIASTWTPERRVSGGGSPLREPSLSSQGNQGSKRVNGLPSHREDAGDAGDLFVLNPRSLPVPPPSAPAEKFSQMLFVNEELQARLAQGRPGPSRAAPCPRAPEPQLSPHSDTSEVRTWLQAKGFSLGCVPGGQGDVDVV